MDHRIIKLGAAGMLLTVSCGVESVAVAPQNVVLVCLDTVRADHVGSYGYSARETTPFLDRMAAEGMRFEDTSATACWTKPSVPSILTGLLPMQHGVYRGSSKDEAGSFTDVLPEKVLTLAEAFQEHGYQTAAFVRNSQLRRGLGFEQGFELYRDQAGDAREIRWRASDWLKRRDPARPFFLYLHLLDAHWPYATPEEVSSDWSDEALVKRIRSSDWRAFRDAINHGERDMSEAEREALIGLYDSSIRFMDDQLGIFWSEIEQLGLAPSTVFCVLADHGEEFLEHGRLGHGHGLYENLLQVPWILRIPGRAPARIAARASLLDLYPTLLSAAGLVAGEADLPGVNRLLTPEREERILAEHLDPNRYHLAWIEGDQKTLEVLQLEKSNDRGPRALSEFGLRGRWEVRFSRDASGERWASLMRPAKDEDAGLSEIELKGPVAHLGSNQFEIEGVPVSLGSAPELYGYGSNGQPLLADGTMVKARGNLLDGQLIARKIKVYPPDSAPLAELRGPIEVSGDDAFLLGEIPMRFGPQSSIEFRSERNDLGPGDVAALIRGDGRWIEREIEHFDLTSDPEELMPHARSEGPFTDPEALRELRELLEHRRWQSAQRKRLDQAALDDLQAIGY